MLEDSSAGLAAHAVEASPDVASVEAEQAALDAASAEAAPSPGTPEFQAPQAASETESAQSMQAADGTSAAATDATEATAEAPSAAEATVDVAPRLPGAVGYDNQGRRGWIHTVVGGDTLWDISDAYLGTPWVWPSIWQENEDIANPHRIYPGDQIWITPTEMRRVSSEEAARLLAGEPLIEPAPAALEDALDAGVPLEPAPEPVQVVRYSNIEAVGLITVEEFEAATSIVDSTSPYIWLTQGATVFLGLGDGEVEVGEEFTVFRVSQAVRDPDDHTILGHFVSNLGWIEIVKIHPEAAEGVIRASFSEMRRGDPVTPRRSVPEEIPLRPAVESIQGRIAFVPEHRDMGGVHDFVFLNRGALDGLDVGNTLEVYRASERAADLVRGTQVELPDEIVGSLLVLSARPETSVAMVTRADGELETGDHFRTHAQ